MNKYIFFLMISFGYMANVHAQPLTLEKALALALTRNPEIAAFGARAEAEQSAVRRRYWLDSPRVGLMRENNMTLMQQQMGSMNSWSVSQGLLFPPKYFLMGAAQKARANAAQERLSDKQLEIRQEILTAYYAVYSHHRIHALLNAQRETLREISRIAEARRATGAVPQQDEMKAHVEQTKIENEFLLHQQELYEVQSRLNALLNRDPSESIDFPSGDLATPRLTVSVDEVTNLASEQSNLVKAARYDAVEAEREKKLAHWSYAPDFNLSYRQPFGNNAPDGAYAAAVEFSVPLWFFANESSQVASARARAIQTESMAEAVTRNVQASALSLRDQVSTLSKLLQIYETSLIPQATSALNSSRAAYGAGRVGFQELLDSERSLYEVRIGYFEYLAKYVAALTKLERVVGVHLSSLPFGITGETR